MFCLNETANLCGLTSTVTEQSAVIHEIQKMKEELCERGIIVLYAYTATAGHIYCIDEQGNELTGRHGWTDFSNVTVLV